MPTYTIRKDNDTKDMVCSWGELQEYLTQNPEWKHVLSAPKIIGGRKSHATAGTDDGWKDTLRKIKSGSGKGSTIDI